MEHQMAGFRNKYRVFSQSDEITVPDSEGANVVAVYMDALAKADGSPMVDLGGKDILVQVEVTDDGATGDGGFEVRVQGSLDGGTTWATLKESTTFELNTSSATTAAILLDDIPDAPLYRIGIFSDGTDTGAAGAVKMSLSVKDVQEVMLQHTA